MKKLNKKGALIVTTVFVWLFAATGVAAVALTPTFRERKANEYCIAEGGTADACKQTVAGMSKTEVLAYIKDTADRPRP